MILTGNVLYSNEYFIIYYNIIIIVIASLICHINLNGGWQVLHIYHTFDDICSDYYILRLLYVGFSQ